MYLKWHARCKTSTKCHTCVDITSTKKLKDTWSCWKLANKKFQWNAWTKKVERLTNESIARQLREPRKKWNKKKVFLIPSYSFCAQPYSRHLYLRLKACFAISALRIYTSAAYGGDRPALTWDTHVISLHIFSNFFPPYLFFFCAEAQSCIVAITAQASWEQHARAPELLNSANTQQIYPGDRVNVSFAMRSKKVVEGKPYWFLIHILVFSIACCQERQSNRYFGWRENENWRASLACIGRQLIAFKGFVVFFLFPRKASK